MLLYYITLHEIICDALLAWVTLFLYYVVFVCCLLFVVVIVYVFVCCLCAMTMRAHSTHTVAWVTLRYVTLDYTIHKVV